MGDKAGEIIIRSDINDIWPHELRTAEALKNAGHTVIFIKRLEEDYAKTADIQMDGEIWEIKSPVSGNLAKVRKVLRKALAQSNNIVYDSQRIKDVPDANIEREVRKQAVEIRAIRRLIFINKKRQVIDIK